MEERRVKGLRVKGSAAIRSKTFRGFLFSFVVVFVVSFTFLVAVYIMMIVRMRAEIDSARELDGEQFKAGIDSQIYNIKLFANVYTSSRVMFDFVQDESMLVGPPTGKQFETLWQLSKDLVNVRSTVSALKDAYIYCMDYDRVLSVNGISGSENYYRITYGSRSGYAEQGYDQWKGAFERMVDEGLLAVMPSGDQTSGGISYVSKVSLNPDNEVCVVFNFSPEQMNTYADAFLRRGAWIALTSVSGELVYANSPLFHELELPTENPSSAVRLMTSEGDMMLGSYYSAVTGCTYHVLMPYRTYYDQAYTLQYFGVAAMIAIVFFSLSLVVFLAWRAYRPLGSILELLRAGGGNQENEYAYIQSMIETIRQDNSAMESQLYSRDNLLRNLIVTRLMSGRYDNMPALEQELESSGMELRDENYIVMLVWSDAYYDMDENEANLLRYVVGNVFGELVSERYLSYPVAVEGKTGILICVPDTMGEDEAHSVLAPLAERGKAFFRENFDLDIFIALGNLHSGLLGIREAYAETEKLVELADQEHPVIQAREELRRGEKPFRFFLENGERLVNLILSREIVAAQQMISDEVSSTIKSDPGWKSDMLRYDICLTLLKTLSSANLEPERMEAVDAELSALLNGNRLSAEILGKMTAMIASQIKPTGKKTGSDTLEEDVKQYIAAHYTEPTLSTGEIARHLGLHVNYLSSLYKKKTGESILDIISIYRVSHAKELLCGTAKKIEEIAELSGYQSSQSFFRVFKKYEGITPKQYRELVL